VHRHIVEVAAERLANIEPKVRGFAGLAEMLLFVGDVVLGASNDTCALDTLNGFGNSNAGKDWIWAEAYIEPLAL
jgi:hypothetical protein